MCGRTACTLAPTDIVKACSYRDKGRKRKCPPWVEAPGGQQYMPAYNLAPGAYTPVLLSAKHLSDKSAHLGTTSPVKTSDRVVMPMKWGLTPPWHQGNPYKVPYETNNCRAEGMLDKKTFKVPLHRGNRCVILAEGFFEWKSSKDGKQPYYFYFPQEPFKTSPIKEEVVQLCDKKTVKQKHSWNWDSHPCGDTTVMSDTSNVGHADKIKLDNSSDSDFSSFSRTNAWDFVTNISCVGKDSIKSIAGENIHCPPTFVNQESSSYKDKFSGNVIEETKIPGDGDQSQEEDEVAWNGHKLLTMAGVFDVWKADQNAPPLFSYSVITVSSSPDMDWCHHRMPAILSNAEEVESWLDSSAVPLSQAVSLIKPKVCLTHHAVSKQVNSSRYQAPDCIKPVDIKQSTLNPGCKLMQNWLQASSPGKRKLQDGDGLKESASESDTQHVATPKKTRKQGGETLLMKWLKSGASA